MIEKNNPDKQPEDIIKLTRNGFDIELDKEIINALGLDTEVMNVEVHKTRPSEFKNIFN